MARPEFSVTDIQKTIDELKIYRSGWANDIREGWTAGMKGAKELTYEFYSISANIILALENLQKGDRGDKMAMLLTKKRLEEVVVSADFRYFEVMGKNHACNVVTQGTKDILGAMLEILYLLTKD